MSRSAGVSLQALGRPPKGSMRVSVQVTCTTNYWQAIGWSVSIRFSLATAAAKEFPSSVPPTRLPSCAEATPSGSTRGSSLKAASATPTTAPCPTGHHRHVHDEVPYALSRDHRRYRSGTHRPGGAVDGGHGNNTQGLTRPPTGLVFSPDGSRCHGDDLRGPAITHQVEPASVGGGDPVFDEHPDLAELCCELVERRRRNSGETELAVVHRGGDRRLGGFTCGSSVTTVTRRSLPCDRSTSLLRSSRSTVRVMVVGCAATRSASLAVGICLAGWKLSAVSACQPAKVRFCAARAGWADACTRRLIRSTSRETASWR